MPLAFESLSHGSIAFGFFNIESDMLLLEKYFLFANDFCRHIVDLAENFHKDRFESQWQVYFIAEQEQIGDLTGAIYGIRFTGFIGELYRKFPFPQHFESFKQQPDGHQNQAIVRDMISAYARQIHIPVKAAKRTWEVAIGEYRFSRKTFEALIEYVWQGGYPRWKDEIRPAYVLNMKTTVERHRQVLFENIEFG